jgi:drug/metabolite transporter (DMT)-like permease
MPLMIQSNALIALAAAAFWGGGDFSGGMGVKAEGGTTADALRVILTANALSLVGLMFLLWLRHAPVPHGTPLLWGLVAGTAAAAAVTAFYIALSRGAMGASAAVSGLLAAAIPAVLSTITEGAPSHMRMSGFVLAAVAIWLIAAGPAPDASDIPHQRRTMSLAIGAGVGFGIYFVALRMANPLGLLEPTALARAGSLTVCGLFLLVLHIGSRRSKPQVSTAGGGTQGLRPWLGRAALLWACAIAVIDTAGNILFIAATRMGRLDVASVLASLYPAGTILLAAWYLHERPTRRQFAGMAVALAAVPMIAF